jgi:CheY-like chemotaxis protein
MKKILVVEDNDKNMYLMNFLLTKKGYQVIKAETGEKGVELAIKEKPDMILMDILLPGIDGYEAIKRIRESETDKKFIIVAVTSYAMTGDRERILKVGSNGYIEKPINPETFLLEIEKFLK